MGRVLRSLSNTKEQYHIVPPTIFSYGEESEILFDSSLALSDQEIVDRAHSRIERLVDQASEDARHLINNAIERSEAIIRKADEQAVQRSEEGYRDGFERGRVEFQESAQQDVLALKIMIKDILDGARQERIHYVQESEQEILRLSCEIARKIIHDTVDLSLENSSRVVTDAVQKITNYERVVVKINPQDFEFLQAHCDNIDRLNPHQELRFVADNRIDRGGVLFETDAGTIDGRITTQLDQVEKVLGIAAPESEG